MSLTRNEVIKLLGQHGLVPSRALGQNFVVDLNTIVAVVRAACLSPEDSVVEIGPGLGSLTTALAAEVQRVLTVEADSYLLAPLQEVLEASQAVNVEVVHADATTQQWREHLGDGSQRWVLVANLPYNIAVPLLLDLLDSEPRIGSFTVMLQTEVAERLVADVGTKAYGIPSLKVAYWCEARIVRSVAASVFYPRPKVSSAVVRLERRPVPATDVDPRLLFDLIRAAFGQRRKMLRRSLSTIVHPHCFARADVDPTARPEQLTLAQWACLAKAHLADAHSRS
ncbi:MAG: 16S rRNA (adenine(1518)-N(6)/adenine(1519)-N(6))-dimethyltransferase RsmA [Acidimicrobiia bacterium]|nr:16S rRNA (adenine(1518)-N(6)/adenine(1519)-N(6))-dimethyltransferase RsmA [Acidimicrobiia bacterium]MYC57870.1 16S rRNA (adenine(1518)-N(6)/adenine(1519)-N(6))-dimethyltransferase RsmA [Acidimicrobiia bacterium]MYG93423.1 16S rRNA (adenine(1518)-N(6)/adenine(1519)-N(6))-dimethyltransferase RsmA [Acidimicrobiia bacterium]MYI31179.1 16S rRNA (adenine(1518)-N(6)/adenine(1519)-N(6))-dimethyltransferase RsmA [Acidimicrobiia bacterium]